MPKHAQRNRILKYKLVLFIFSLFVVLILFFLNVTVAKPSSRLFFNLKRLSEKTQLSFKSTPEDKLNYLDQLLDERLSELVFIVEKGNSPYVLTTSLRYSTTAGQITELIMQNNLRDEARNAKKNFEKQLLVIKTLPQKYPKDDQEIKYVIDDANYLEIYIGKLSSL